jgi:hypothetical protein
VKTLPLLVFYVVIVLVRHDVFPKDEITYLAYAANLLAGHYAPTGSEFLWCGPGYPLLLAPFVAVGAPLIWIKLLNAVLLWGAVLLFHRTLLLYESPRRAGWIALAFALYWPFFDQMPRVMTEVFTVFLVTAALHSACHLFRADSTSRARLFVTAFLLAYLALTKVLFGYVLLVVVAIGLVAWLVSRRDVHRRALFASGLALVLCLPYLVYTFSITGKAFCWATSGGMQLYWMATPHEEEKGDWINYLISAKNDPTEANPLIRRHGELFSEAFGFEDPTTNNYYVDEPWHEMVLRLDARQDAVFFDAALENIADHPGKFARNWSHNVQRMLIDAPYSYRESLTFWKFGVPNTLLILLILRGIFRHRESPWTRPREFAPIAVFVATYLAGTSLVSAYPRQFYIVVPFFAWWGTLRSCATAHNGDGKGGTAPGPAAGDHPHDSP